MGDLGQCRPARRLAPATLPGYRAHRSSPPCFGTLTWNQVRVWHDSEKLWSHAVAIDPRSPIGQIGLGLALARQGKLAEAIAHYEQALRIKPDHAAAHTNWGVALARQGHQAEADAHYQEALHLRTGPSNTASKP